MKISVILTSYNYSQYLKDAINSILNQTFTDFELIIIDDCSSDNSVEIINSFSDERIKFIQNTENHGLTYSMEKAISIAKGEWIAFLESDDLWVSNTLEKRLDYIKKYQDIGMIFNDVEEFGDENWLKVVRNNFIRTRKILSKKTFPKNMFYDFNVHNLIMTFSSVMVKREKFKNLNFKTPIDSLLDWWIYIHIAYDTTVFYIDEKLTKWRQHKNSYIMKKSMPHYKFANIEAYLDVYKCHNLSITFIPFLLFSLFLMLLNRLKFYYVIFIRKIKDIFGIKKKDSPLFSQKY